MTNDQITSALERQAVSYFVRDGRVIADDYYFPPTGGMKRIETDLTGSGFMQLREWLGY